jgi:4-carboxymuconolactone decarboxylase
VRGLKTNEGRASACAWRTAAPALDAFAAPGVCSRVIQQEKSMPLSQDPETQAGLATRRKVLGEEYVNAALGRTTPFTDPMQELVTKHCWGNTWQRDAIDLKTRSMITVAMLVALNRPHELKAHVRGALNNGVTREQLQEIFLHSSVYCGFPAAIDGLRNAAEVIDAK